MCGVIGYTPINDAFVDKKQQLFKQLFLESSIRGKHFYGIAQLAAHPFPTASIHPLDNFEVTRSAELLDIPQFFSPFVPAIAHTRFSQSGDWKVAENNQPIISKHRALAMNGVIDMGRKSEYEYKFEVKCEVDNDAEIFLRRMEKGELSETFINRITGSFAATWIDSDKGTLFSARNERRPLWKCVEQGAIWIASTKDIFQRAGFIQPKTLLESGVEHRHE